MKFTKGPAKFHCDLPRSRRSRGRLRQRTAQRFPFDWIRILDSNRAAPSGLHDQPVPDQSRTGRPARPEGDGRVPGGGEAFGALAPPEAVGGLAAHPRCPGGPADAAGLDECGDEGPLPFFRPAVNPRADGRRYEGRPSRRGRRKRADGHALLEHKKNNVAIRARRPSQSRRSSDPVARPKRGRG